MKKDPSPRFLSDPCRPLDPSGGRHIRGVWKPMNPVARIRRGRLALVTTALALLVTACGGGGTSGAGGSANKTPITIAYVTDLTGGNSGNSIGGKAGFGSEGRSAGGGAGCVGLGGMRHRDLRERAPGECRTRYGESRRGLTR